MYECSALCSNSTPIKSPNHWMGAHQKHSALQCTRELRVSAVQIWGEHELLFSVDWENTLYSVCWWVLQGAGPQSSWASTVHTNGQFIPGLTWQLGGRFTLATPPSRTLRHTWSVRTWPELPRRAVFSLTNYGLRALTAIKTQGLWFV